MYSKENTKFIRKRSFYGDGWWELECVVCGDLFDSNQSYAKYCSQRCANDAAIAKRKEKMQNKRAEAEKCVICGKPIEQGEYSKIRKYCSNACKQKAYRARKTDIPADAAEKAEEYQSKSNIECEAISQNGRATIYANMMKNL